MIELGLEDVVYHIDRNTSLEKLTICEKNVREQINPHTGVKTIEFSYKAFKHPIHISFVATEGGHFRCDDGSLIFASIQDLLDYLNEEYDKC